MKFLNHEVIRVSLKEDGESFNVQINGPTYPELFYALGMETYKILIKDLGLSESDIDQYSEFYKEGNFIIENLYVDGDNANVIFYTDKTFEDKNLEGQILLMEQGERPTYSLEYEDMLVFANTMFRIVALAAQLEANEQGAA